jgi:hypothetical protein
MPYTDYYSTPTIEDNFLFDQTAVSKTGGGRVNLSKTPRPLSNINGLCLHQTGLPSAAAGNDPDKFRGVRTHFVITPDGSCILNHNPEVYCNASNRLNKFTVAVEFVGNFRSERNKWWKGDSVGRDHMTDEQVMAGRWLVLYCRDFINIKNVYCHRQSSKGKNCCGPDVWYHVGQWAVDVLKLGDGGTNYHIPDEGAAIPAAWRTWNQAP